MEAAAPPPQEPPLTREQALQQAQAEGLTLRTSSTNQSGYVGVAAKLSSGRFKPYQAEMWHGGRNVFLGSFSSAEEAALSIARTLKGQAAAGERVVPPSTAQLMARQQQALQQAQAEGLTLRTSDTRSGYVGVYEKLGTGRRKPFMAEVWQGGTKIHLGAFSTAEEAALCVARSPADKARVKRAAVTVAAPPKAQLTGEQTLHQVQAEGLSFRTSNNQSRVSVPSSRTLKRAASPWAGSSEEKARRRRRHPSGKVDYFEGERGAERVVRAVFPSGNVQQYEGEAGDERLVRIVVSNGDVEHFEGGRGAEHLVHIVLVNGDVEIFEGESGVERFVVRKHISHKEGRYYGPAHTARHNC